MAKSVNGNGDGKTEIPLEVFRSEQNRVIRQTGLLLVKTVNEWIQGAKTRPIPRMLFDSFWFENELCILFADTNLGKSILAVQIANSISAGQPISGFRMQTGRQKVLYLDCELSDKQFEHRYSDNYQNHYVFSENFIRAEINADITLPEGVNFEGYLTDCLEKSIQETQSRILIIDNITYLRTETERAREALPLMKHLKSLKARYGLSMLILAHTPKRDISKQLTRNDLQGSKMLINFCDSAFAIGESFKDKSVRYLKQIKARSIEVMYDSRNICVCQIIKQDNFLSIEFLDYEYENDHLKFQSDDKQDEIESQILELYNSGVTCRREIARQVNTYPMKVTRTLRKELGSSVVDDEESV